MRVWINKRDGENEIIAEAQDLELVEIIPGTTDGEDTFFIIGIIKLNGVEHDINVEVNRNELVINKQD